MGRLMRFTSQGEGKRIFFCVEKPGVGCALGVPRGKWLGFLWGNGWLISLNGGNDLLECVIQSLK